VPFFLDVEDNLRVAGLAEANLIAVGELALGHPLAIDECSEPALLVPDDAVAVVERNLRVHARDVGAGQAQIRFASAADREERLVDGDNAPPERVGDDETWRRA
jgi:hypothetical protein